MMNNRLYKKVKGYQNISFDMFDTLIERNVILPTDIFFQAGKSVLDDGEKFREQRILAERKARAKHQSKEVTLDQIYLELGFLYDEQILNELKEKEISEELSNCNPRKDIVEVYRKLIKEGKNVFIVTDMYLPKDTLSMMLRKCSIDDYKDLLLSNEEEAGKRDGKLFEILLQRYDIQSQSLIHIGDDLKSDYLGAKKVGITSVIIPRKRAIRRQIKSEIIKSKLHGKSL
jgi:HAD superfamily hydrolase (TIGR01549 family)